MNKVDTYEFVLRINVPPGKHHYKFIVDDKWKFAPDQPTEMDGEGRVNNVVEVKSIESSAEHLCSTDEDREDDTSYGQTIPMSDEYSTDPPILPPQLGLSLLNASSKSVPFRSESTQALQQLEPTLLPVPQHVTVNHLYLSEKNMAELGDEVLVLGVTQRYKTKYITTVLYKPRQTSNSGSFNIQES